MKKTLYNQLNRIRDNGVPILCVILAVSILAVPAVAQSQTTFVDDFEDGDAEGWQDNNGTQMQVQSESYNDTYSGYTNSDDFGDNSDINPVYYWRSGPVLDMSKDFMVNGTMRYSQTTGAATVRVGLQGQNQTAVGENALLVFDDDGNQVYLATAAAQPVPGDTINTDFENTWVNFRLQSEAGSGTLKAKVWEAGTAEPDSFQLQESGFDGISGEFGLNPGRSETQFREIWLDEVEITGTQTNAIDEDLLIDLDIGNYLEYGQAQEYRVYELVGPGDRRVDITDDTVVSSSNSSVVSVNQATNTLQATSDESINQRVNITANYEGRITVEPVTVASPTIENLPILPFVWRISAMFLDRGFQMILVSLLLAVAATRVAGVFAGLGIYQMGLTAGWLIGWVPIGLAMVGLFTTLFIGLNIAANIDYTVRR